MKKQRYSGLSRIPKDGISTHHKARIRLCPDSPTVMFKTTGTACLRSLGPYLVHFCIQSTASRTKGALYMVTVLNQETEPMGTEEVSSEGQFSASSPLDKSVIKPRGF